MFDEFFNTFGLTAGVLIIIGVGLVLFLIIAVFLERRTKILFPERPKPKDSDDSLFFDDDEEDES